MKLRSDIKAHLFWGLIMSLFLLATALAARQFGIGVAVMLASFAGGWGVEKYQAVRGEGTPDWRDWVASSVPGVAIGFAIGLWEAMT